MNESPRIEEKEMCQSQVDKKRKGISNNSNEEYGAIIEIY